MIAALLQPATLKAVAPAEYDVQFVTSAGEFTMHVTRAWAPNGADRFYNLVRHHFYDGAAFFRVLPGFMAQFGMSAYPQVSRAWENANIKDDKVTQSNKRGYVSFAMAGPNTRTTQIFINYGNNTNLDGSGFSPFAMVTAGDGHGGQVLQRVWRRRAGRARSKAGFDRIARPRLPGKRFSKPGQDPVGVDRASRAEAGRRAVAARRTRTRALSGQVPACTLILLALNSKSDQPEACP